MKSSPNFEVSASVFKALPSDKRLALKLQN